MRNVTESDERALGILAWICDCCKNERQTLPVYPETKPRRIPPASLANGKHSRDPRMRGIRRRWRRWQVRIWQGDPSLPRPGKHASGRGRFIYIGSFKSEEEAIRARDQALKEMREAEKEAAA